MLLLETGDDTVNIAFIIMGEAFLPFSCLPQSASQRDRRLLVFLLSLIRSVRHELSYGLTDLVRI